MPESVVADILLVNQFGLHARPVLKLNRIAKQFPGLIEVSINSDGPWADAKSPVQLMRIRAPNGSRLFIRLTCENVSSVLPGMIDQIRENIR
jgi:phosphocarrier protein